MYIYIYILNSETPTKVYTILNLQTSGTNTYDSHLQNDYKIKSQEDSEEA